VVVVLVVVVVVVGYVAALTISFMFLGLHRLFRHHKATVERLQPVDAARVRKQNARARSKSLRERHCK
jgi:hypothetical protein